MKLQTKILLIFSSLALLLGGPLLVTVRSAVNQILLQDVEKRGILIASDIVLESAGGFKDGREAMLLPFLQIAQEQINADYVLALSPSGDVLAHTNVAEKGKHYDDSQTLKELQSTSILTHVFTLQDKAVMRISAPVWLVSEAGREESFLLGGGEEATERVRLGTVRLELPLQEVFATQYRLFRKVAAIVLTAGAIGLVLILIFMRRLLLPIRFLSEGTSRVRAGEYGVRVPVLSKDELGRLAEDFNSMSQALSETTVSKDFLGNILSNMSDPLIVLTMKNVIQMVNQATLDLLGYSQADLVGRPAHALFMSSEKTSARVEQETLILKGAVHNLEVEFLKKTGEKVSVLFSSSVMKDGMNQPSGIIAVAKDMTERKRLENIIRQSDKMSAVGQLAAGVAHEINNPLGVILGFAQAALRKMPAGDRLEMPLQSIEKEALRCKNLVQDLLTFSRVSKVDREPMDLNKTIETAVSLVSTRARVCNIDVRRELSADLPRLLGNPNQIQQVIINLANNAFDAIGEHGGALSVKTEKIQEGPLCWIGLTVADTGPGIPADVLPRIFEPFFTTKPVGKGTGLGLSLIHEIVKKHSGMIDVKSRPGATEFFLKFPVRQTLGRASYVL